MTRPTNQDAIEKEARLQETMATVLTKKHTTSSTAHAFNIPRQTLYNRLDGKPPRNKAHETEQLLSHAEEKELVRWITRLTITDYPPRYDTLREMAEEIRKRCVISRKSIRISISGVARIQKMEWLTVFVIAHEKALRIENILSGFRGTDIHPFEPTKVLNRVASSSPSTQTRSSIPSIPTNPFNDAVLTSSPVDFNDVQTANIALNDMIASGNPISTPAKKYVIFLTKNVERLQAVNIIVQYENEQLKAHVHQRKRQLSGKRQVIDGKHIITMAELIGIQKAEKAIWVRKEK